ncbi:hypothetical protein MTBBW1_1860005 [Desulfamplus magnetovallimortis]|uniref:PilZ domain-containing protein n=1 Tax=Desulfamplus magnetovallimortis TaxID=1246637 RepID=A0A1W1HAU7_9BACT|nr:PilZ domain-containing protein [Desulfamplus magnetovallimortis]SLM29515.1 hypothetical protein MTBBW1_1860005 [Desulfamplus magnetovallimortis]
MSINLYEKNDSIFVCHNCGFKQVTIKTTPPPKHEKSIFKSNFISITMTMNVYEKKNPVFTCPNCGSKQFTDKEPVIYKHEESIFKCPHCHFEQTFNIAPFIEKGKKNISVKCRCKEVSEITIESSKDPNKELRKDFRKEVSLKGSCLIEKTNKKCEIVLVRNISRSGLRMDYFIMDKKCMAELEPEDIVTIEFELDDSKRHLVKKRCIVRFKMEGYIGVEFIDDEYAREIGMFLW